MSNKLSPTVHFKTLCKEKFNTVQRHFRVTKSGHMTILLQCTVQKIVTTLQFCYLQAVGYCLHMLATTTFLIMEAFDMWLTTWLTTSLNWCLSLLFSVPLYVMCE